MINQPTEIVIRNTTFSDMPGAKRTEDELQWHISTQVGYEPFSSETDNIVALRRISVESHNGNPEDNFQLFFPEQHPKAILRETEGLLIGAPEPGRTNQDWWDTLGIAFGGEVARCQDTRPEIQGYVCRESVPPQVRVAITSPPDQAAVGGTVVIEADATADKGIERVDFFVDYTFLATAYEEPYNAEWDSTTVAQGEHTLTAIASDAKGRRAEHSIRVTVKQVDGAPIIVREPQDRMVRVGQRATFRVTAQGAPRLRYQWQRDGEDIPGANRASYTTQRVTREDNGATFRCVVWNSRGTAVSRAAILRVR